MFQKKNMFGICTGCKSKPDQHMAHQTFAGLLLVCRNAVSSIHARMWVQNLFVLLHAKIAVPVFHDLMRSSRIKSGNQFPVFYPVRSGTVLCFDTGTETPSPQSAPSEFRMSHRSAGGSGQFFFSLKLGMVHNQASVTTAAAWTLPRRPTGIRGARTVRSDTQPCVAVIFLCFIFFTSARSPITVSLTKEGKPSICLYPLRRVPYLQFSPSVHHFLR